jgi:hypothetical protein
LKSPTGRAFAAAAPALLEAAEAEDPLAVLSPLVVVEPAVGAELVPPVAVAVAVAVAAGPLHTIGLGILGKIVLTGVGGLEKEGKDTLEKEGVDSGVYVWVSGDVLKRLAVLM